MPITPINSNINSKPKYNLPKITGYAAAGLGISSAIAASNKKISLHKTLAYASGILALIHIAIIEWHHHVKNR